MNSDLDDDTVPLEPPLIPRLSTLTSTSPRHSKRDHQHSDFNSLQTYESPNNYDSDQIDPELEELFYTSIHHQTIGSMELTFDHFNQSTETQLSSTQPEETPLNEFPKVKSEDVKIFNSRKSLKKERKQIRAAREKALAAAEAASQFTVEPVNSSRPKLDLCFGNLIVGDGITSTPDPEEAMNKFYNEDLYDSDEERANYKRMSSDKRFWKIGQEDMLSNFGRRSLRFRQKECKHCGGGHLVKDCPRVCVSLLLSKLFLTFLFIIFIRNCFVLYAAVLVILVKSVVYEFALFAWRELATFPASVQFVTS